MVDNPPDSTAQPCAVGHTRKSKLITFVSFPVYDTHPAKRTVLPQNKDTSQLCTYPLKQILISFYSEHNKVTKKTYHKPPFHFEHRNQAQQQYFSFLRTRAAFCQKLRAQLQYKKISMGRRDICWVSVSSMSWPQKRTFPIFTIHETMSAY